MKKLDRIDLYKALWICWFYAFFLERSSTATRLRAGLQSFSDLTLQAEEGTLYPCLYRLERQG